jgi:opacity protein-like surface antigen
MKRLCGSIVVGALVALAAAAPAEAQKPFIFFGGGVSLPMSDFKDVANAKTGWIAQAGIGVDIGTKGLWADAEGFFGNNKVDDDSGDEYSTIGGLGVLGYSFSTTAKVSPYVLGGLGFLRNRFTPEGGESESSTNFAYTGGVGLGFRISPKALFYVEGRYMGGDTQFLPIMAGFSFSFGSGGSTAGN